MGTKTTQTRPAHTGKKVKKAAVVHHFEAFWNESPPCLRLYDSPSHMIQHAKFTCSSVQELAAWVTVLQHRPFGGSMSITYDSEAQELTLGVGAKTPDPIS